MVASKKKVNQTKQPKSNYINQGGNPNQYYSKFPSWQFLNCDKEYWSISSKECRNYFWNEVFPFLQNLETRTWGEILIHAKKHNHNILVDDLNKKARDRLALLHIEAEALISLRVTATHRIYGYITNAVFNILWIDFNHGDNLTCVCRSVKKHT